MTNYTSKPQALGDLLNRHLRQTGLETPLLQHSIMSKWQEVAGEQVSKYTEELSIRNQTLYVKITHAALRADLSMMRKQLTERLNQAVESMVITDIKFY